MAGLVTGNKTASKIERGNDFNATPYEALAALLAAERRNLPRRIWEPAAGSGSLVVPLRNRGFDVTATELRYRGCPDCTGGIDFLSDVAERYRPPGDKVGIVTNPPFGIVEEFIERAAASVPYVALMMRLAFLESEGRFGWWQRMGLRRVHLIVERLPMMHREGYEGPKLSKSAMAFAWFIFEPMKPPPRFASLRWVSYRAALRKHPFTEADLPPESEDRPALLSWGSD